jgi:hypothetical protein
MLETINRNGGGDHGLVTKKNHMQQKGSKTKKVKYGSGMQWKWVEQLHGRREGV